MKQAAFQASYSDWKLIKSRRVVQIVLEISLEDSGHAYEVLGGMPRPDAEIWCGVARLGKAVVQGRPTQTERGSDKTQPRQVVAQQSGGARTNRDWAQLVPSEQAGILCNDGAFWRFLREEHGYSVTCMDEAARAVRVHCGVESRRDIADNQRARMIFHQLVEGYRLWQRAPECVP